MTSFTEEIQKLQLRILELEKEKEKEQHENDKKIFIEKNLKIINDILNEKKIAINNDRYSTVPLAKFQDQLLVKHLEPVYDILEFLHHRISKLEEKQRGLK